MPILIYVLDIYLHLLKLLMWIVKFLKEITQRIHLGDNFVGLLDMAAGGGYFRNEQG